ncbi:hypothetical protein [Rhizobium sp. B21/90]|uniref:hypothetical protein n=1 Tax=Rhizobium sp. B21/90 TaxID=2819993 RepID=UPI001C5AC068|nr:hypothetical protein [Rhizobium sp. B21/90]QYA04143.1 hypothetical protein J5278_25755 [Rhizobium sp. B21/90]
MTINRFEGLAAELNRLAAEIAAINSQPFNVGIDLGAEALISGTVFEGSTGIRRWCLCADGGSLPYAAVSSRLT